MQSASVRVAAVALVVAACGANAAAAWPWQTSACRSGAGTTFTDTGCGPRVPSPCHEPLGPVDQCDACARFAGCDGYRQRPELLAPWQLPPGRGFQPAEAVGYLPAACAECAACRPRHAWPW